MEITGSENASKDFVPLVGANYAMKLKNSVQELISELRKESLDLSLFLDAFYELMQAHVDPPFEAIWVYAAIKFRSLKSEKGDALDRILAAKALFQVLSACSASVGASKSVALLAPIVCEVHNVLLELFGRELKLKREKKAMREVKSLVDVIVGYISICCSSNSSEEEHDCAGLNLIMDFADLACVWVNANDGDGDGNGFHSLFPLLSSDVLQWLCAKGFHVGNLGGAVMMEAFFMKLCLLCHLKTPGRELEMNLKSWAVGSITSFQNIYFLEILMTEALIGKPLPLISSILKSEKEVLLRKVLFDALLLVEYPFLYYTKNLAFTRLVVTDEGIKYFRGSGDQNRAISYIREFSASRIPSQIIKWVSSQTGLEEKAGSANGSSPRALLSWLVSLENRGIRVFEDDILRSHAKFSVGVSQDEQPAGILDDKADDDLFYVDNAGEEGNTSGEDKQNELISDAFVAAAQTMKTSDSGSRKRKGKSDERKIKFVKYDLQNSLRANARTSAANDSSSGESEVEDRDSDAEA